MRLIRAGYVGQAANLPDPLPDPLGVHCGPCASKMP